MSIVLKVSEKFAEKVFSVFENSFSAHVLFFLKEGGKTRTRRQEGLSFFRLFW